jgi:hypothetical protein
MPLFVAYFIRAHPQLFRPRAFHQPAVIVLTIHKTFVTTTGGIPTGGESGFEGRLVQSPDTLFPQAVVVGLTLLTRRLTCGCLSVVE